MTASSSLVAGLKRVALATVAVSAALGIGAGTAVAQPTLPGFPSPVPAQLSDSPIVSWFNDLLPVPPTSLPSPFLPTAPAAPAPAPAPAPAAAPASPCPPTARACVDLANNTTWLQQDGHISFGPVRMSSGKPGYETTKGDLRVLRKVKDEWSVPYNGPMPYSVYFTTDGMAFHEGSVDVQSHGCIHLNHDAAVTYFDQLQVGDSVFIY
nr:L,D-transpeptidase [Corynebacterium lactis]